MVSERVGGREGEADMGAGNAGYVEGFGNASKAGGVFDWALVVREGDGGLEGCVEGDVW